MKIFKDIKQGSPEWFNLKLGKITGSRVKDVLKTDNLSLVDELIAEIITEQMEECYQSFEMQRGSELEPIARKAYEEFKGVSVEQVGFISSGKYPWLGLSPDGLIANGEKYVKGIEIKCPKTSTHVKYIRQNTLPNDYKPQVLLYFLVGKNIDEVDFISYDNRFTIRPIHIVTVKREEVQKDIDELEKALLKFWDKFEKYYNQITF